MMEPQQALFTAVRGKLLESYPDSVYDGHLPGSDTPYPFIYLGEFDQYDRETKSVILGNDPCMALRLHEARYCVGNALGGQIRLKECHMHRLQLHGEERHNKDHGRQYNYNASYAWHS